MRSTKIVSLLTFLWIAVGLTLISIKLETIKTMPLNELGDFTAGFFSPLAFLWLIAGYIQQGKELKLNTEALQLQASELNQSVAQQRELVAVTKAEAVLNRQAYEKELEREVRSIQPLFAIETISYRGRDQKIHDADILLVNKGAECTDVKICCESARINRDEIPHMINGAKFDIKLTAIQLLTEFIVKVSYIDKRNKLRAIQIRSQLTREGNLIHFPSSDPLAIDS